MNDLSQKLRSVCLEIRRKPYPISDLIPLLQKAADELERLQKEVNVISNRQ